MTARPAALAVLWVAAGAGLASALAPIRGLASFQGGLLHPVLVPAHVLTLAALGLLISQQPHRERTALLVVFAAALCAGIGAIMTAAVFTAGTLVLLAVGAIAGLLVARARPVPLLLVAPLAAAAGVALAFDSVPHEISIAATLHALAGTAIGAALTVTFVACTMADLQRAWLHIAVRIVGSWSAASAILVLALRLAR